MRNNTCKKKKQLLTCIHDVYMTSFTLKLYMQKLQYHWIPIEGVSMSVFKFSTWKPLQPKGGCSCSLEQRTIERRRSQKVNQQQKLHLTLVSRSQTLRLGWDYLNPNPPLSPHPDRQLCRPTHTKIFLHIHCYSLQLSVLATNGC